MPAYSKEKTKQLLERIRRVLVMNPRISVLDIQSALENSKKDPIHLDKDYINRLRNKIEEERANRYHNYTVKKVLAKHQDELEEMKLRLWAIANNKESNNQERTSAIREIRNANKDIFDAMFNSGLFTKDLGKIDTGMGEVLKAIQSIETDKNIINPPGEPPTKDKTDKTEKTTTE